MNLFRCAISAIPLLFLQSCQLLAKLFVNELFKLEQKGCHFSMSCAKYIVAEELNDVFWYTSRTTFMDVPSQKSNKRGRCPQIVLECFDSA